MAVLPLLVRPFTTRSGWRELTYYTKFSLRGWQLWGTQMEYKAGQFIQSILPHVPPPSTNNISKTADMAGRFLDNER
jgi:hypothetical protein